MEYELMPVKKYKIARKGGKGKTMPDKIVAAPIVRPAKRYQPSRWEVLKTIAIAVLISGIIAFVLGMRYANSQHARLDRAVESAVTVKK